jgi:hypothetical protein
MVEAKVAGDTPATLAWSRDIYFYFSYHTWYFHSLMTSAFWRQNILRHFAWSAPPLLYYWSHSPIGCSAPLYSRSGSLIRSAYYFLYISLCFRFNKSLMNLTSLRQHHLQYTDIVLVTPGANVIKLFLWFRYFHAQLLFVGLDWKSLPMTNTLVYYKNPQFTIKKSFITLVPGCMKIFAMMIIIPQCCDCHYLTLSLYLLPKRVGGALKNAYKLA